MGANLAPAVNPAERVKIFERLLSLKPEGTPFELPHHKIELSRTTDSGYSVTVTPNHKDLCPQRFFFDANGNPIKAQVNPKMGEFFDCRPDDPISMQGADPLLLRANNHYQQAA